MQRITVKWSQVPVSNLIIPRSSHGVSLLGNKFLVFGGEHEARTPIDSEINILDLEADTKTWETIRNYTGAAPVPRVGHAQAVVREPSERLYIFGGRLGVSNHENLLDDLHYFDFSSNSWNEVRSEGGPSGRSYHQMVGIGATLYVFGGCPCKGRSNEIYKFDIPTSTWTKLSSNEGLTGRGGAVFERSKDGESLFVIAGFIGKEMNDIWKYSIKSDTWEKINTATSFTARSVCSSGLVSIGDKNLICVAGGEVDPSSKGHAGAGSHRNDVVLFDYENNELVEIEPTGAAPEPRGWNAGAGYGDKFYLYGGLAGSDENPIRLGDLWSVELSNN